MINVKCPCCQKTFNIVITNSGVKVLRLESPTRSIQNFADFLMDKGEKLGRHHKHLYTRAARVIGNIKYETDDNSRGNFISYNDDIDLLVVLLDGKHIMWTRNLGRMSLDLLKKELKLFLSSLK